MCCYIFYNVIINYGYFHYYIYNIFLINSHSFIFFILLLVDFQGKREVKVRWVPCPQWHVCSFTNTTSQIVCLTFPWRVALWEDAGFKCNSVQMGLELLGRSGNAIFTFVILWFYYRAYQHNLGLLLHSARPCRSNSYSSVYCNSSSTLNSSTMAIFFQKNDIPLIVLQKVDNKNVVQYRLNVQYRLQCVSY